MYLMATNSVKNSPFFAEIMEFYDKNYQKMTVKDMVTEIVKIDTNLSRTPTKDFLHYLNKKRKQKAENIIEAHAENNALDEVMDSVTLFKKIKSRAHQLGDEVMESTAQEILAYREKGKPIPDFKKKMVMNWFFRFKESEQKDRQIELMNKQSQQQERLVDGLLNNLIYSRDLQPEDIIEAEYEDLGHQDAIQIATRNPEGASATG